MCSYSCQEGTINDAANDIISDGNCQPQQLKMKDSRAMQSNYETALNRPSKAAYVRP
jgi:hypothetical protein